ncbi:MAG: binding domain protein [Clostridia bacterium]|nr:binding domain protein [Clostridia bacterium]
MTIEVGAILEGVVAGITKFGAFVELPGGLTGLVHISEVADNFVKDIKDYVKEADRVKVKVIRIDDKGKIGLSMKRVDAAHEASPHRRRQRAADIAFEEKLARFMKESDERLQDLRRHTESKRGGRGSRYNRMA